MSFGSVQRKIYMEPITVTGEAVGTGDAAETTFSLDYTTVRDGTLTVYLDGSETSAYTPNLTTGEIEFTAAPGLDVAITADYISGYESLALEATGETVVIGFVVSNATEDDGEVTVTLGDYVSVLPVPAGSGIEPLPGKTVLETGDELHVTASDDDLLTMELSYMEVS